MRGGCGVVKPWGLCLKITLLRNSPPLKDCQKKSRRNHFGKCAVEKLLWATQGSLWPVCCERATLGDSGITLASVP